MSSCQPHTHEFLQHRYGLFEWWYTTLVTGQAICLFSERSFLNRLRIWKICSYIWRPTLQELCRTCWFWGTWGSTLVLSNTSKHMSSRNSSCIASRACHHLVNLKKQFRSWIANQHIPPASTVRSTEPDVTQQQKVGCSSHRSLLWRPDTAQSSSLKRKPLSHLSKQVRGFHREHHPPLRQEHFQMKAQTFEHPAGVEAFYFSRKTGSFNSTQHFPFSTSDVIKTVNLPLK